MCLRGGDATVSLLRMSVLGSTSATAKAADVVARRSIFGPASLAGTNGSMSPFNGEQSRRQKPLPVHRSILAVDIEGPTRRTNPAKWELRDEVYRLVVEALCVSGIDS
jgi:hypothetical protein